MAGARRQSPELVFHKTVVEHLRLSMPAAIPWWHTPNGGARSASEGGKLKAMGTLAGVPDLLFILPHGVAAFIELKAGKGTLNPAQKAFRDTIKGRGCPYAECRTIQEVEAFLERLIVPFGYQLRARVA